MKSSKTLESAPEEAQSRIVVLCDKPFEFRDHEGGGIDEIPVYIENNGSWKVVKIEPLLENMSDYLDLEEIDEEELGRVIEYDKEKIREKMGKIDDVDVTILVDSSGGNVAVSESIMQFLQYGKRNFDWKVKTIIGRRAESAALDVAITSDQILASDSSEVMMHGLQEVGHDSSEQTESELVKRHQYPHVEDVVRRLLALSEDDKLLTRSGIQRKIREKLDECFSDNPECRLTGVELKDAGIASADSESEIEKEVATLLESCPKRIKKRIESFANH
jgi:hypothetical protein